MDRVAARERDGFPVGRPIQFAASRNGIAGIDSLFCATFRWHCEDLTVIFIPARKDDAVSIGRPYRAAIVAIFRQLDLAPARNFADKNSGLFLAYAFARKCDVLSVRG